MSITDEFDERVYSNMEVALERVCRLLPKGRDGHEARRYIAARLIESARSGSHTVQLLTLAGRVAAFELESSALQQPARN